ncbi:MAG TPA: Ada metal-binding domain-containing protein [Chryseolinea sp.]|nr:Ada metal-binding domain-containing protein [Chryseolinea sp.]HPH46513.1 Ada metal-binding domain-containing protein [Chryseolinea sp.]HPM29550.1 Ada metal-binding domain-containing protein [Chryseolinea sp.]
MVQHNDVSRAELFNLLKAGQITLGGNRKLKIYGQLNCSSGKRMKKENRIFFKNETMAKQLGFRPCGQCMRDLYKGWKKRSTL